MSANVNFVNGARPATGTTAAAPSSSTAAGNGSVTASPAGKSKSHMILPYEVLFNLVGRRVTVLLTCAAQELEGTLQSVDSDKGDMLLSEVVRYVWAQPRPPPAEGEASDEDRAAAAAAEEEAGFSNCFGGGRRRELSRCSQAMINSAYVALVTPTQFVPE